MTAGTDRSRILEIMMFYRAAGGLQYVGLLNRYQHFLDLSGHLGLNRAILIGIGPPASEVSVDGHPIAADASSEHLTFYRFLLPVRTTDSAGQPDSARVSAIISSSSLKPRPSSLPP